MNPLKVSFHAHILFIDIKDSLMLERDRRTEKEGVVVTGKKGVVVGGGAVAWTVVFFALH